MYFIAVAAGPQNGTYSLTGANIASNFASVSSGVSATDLWVPQTAWSQDPADGSQLLPAIDWTQGNQFQIAMQSHGFTTAVLSVQHPITGRYIAVHVLQDVGTAQLLVRPNTQMTAYATGTSVALNVSHLTAAVSGQTSWTCAALASPTFGAYGGITNVTVNATRQIFFGMKNNPVFRSRVNRQEVLLTYLCVDYSSGTTGNLQVFLNPTFASVANPGMVWTAADANNNSCVSTTNTLNTVTGGTLVFTSVITNTQTSIFPLKALMKILKPGDVLAFTVNTFYGGNALGTEVNISVSWDEAL